MSVLHFVCSSLSVVYDINPLMAIVAIWVQL